MTTTNDRLNQQADRITALERLLIDSRLKALEGKAHTHTDTPPVVTPPPPIPASAGLRVTSVPALLDALANNANTDIVVANGTYPIRGAGFQAPNSLWIGARFAGRTNPVTVRAESKGGVIFDGGGSALGGISFNEGAHDQTWDGFTFANGTVSETGCITLGGYPSAPAHHITMRNITIPASIRGPNRAAGKALDHAVYIGHSATAIHDLAFEDFDIDASGLATGFHLYGGPGAYNAAFRRFRIANAAQALMIYEATLHDIAFEDGTITDSAESAVTYEHPATRISLTRVNSTGTAGTPFVHSGGTAGLTLTSCVLG